MKILFHCQVSMRSYETNKIDINRSSIWSSQKGILKYLKNKGHTIVNVFPENAIISENIFDYTSDFVMYGGYGNIKNFRYHFDSMQYKEIFDNFDFDVILTGFPELVANYQSIDSGMPIVTLFNHIEQQYIFRQYEGYLRSDLDVFPTLMQSQKFERLVKECVGRFEVKPTQTWKAFVSKDDYPAIDYSKKISNLIVYPSRLTDNQRTNYDLFVKMLPRLVEEGFIIEVCNPTEIEMPQDLIPFSKSLIFHRYGLSKQEYIDLLEKAGFSLILYGFDDYLSVNIIESLIMGARLITFKSQDLADIFSDEYRSNVIKIDKNYLDLDSVINTIIQYKDTPVKINQEDVLDKCSGEHWGVKAEEVLQTVVARSKK